MINMVPTHALSHPCPGMSVIEESEVSINNSANTELCDQQYAENFLHSIVSDPHTHHWR